MACEQAFEVWRSALLVVEMASQRKSGATCAGKGLDFGQEGLREHLHVLDHSGISYAGAGDTLAEAHKPAVISPLHDRTRFAMLSYMRFWHDRYRSRGVVVLGFPSNDFMGQEPGSEEEIQEFCTLTYGVKFPMFEKVQVRGDTPTPLYADMIKATGEAPGWNFHKYLIDREGNVVASFGSRTKPEDPKLVAEIEKLLAQPAPAKPAPKA